MTNVAVLVPRRADGGRRDQVWDWIRPWWEPLGPVTEGHHDDGPFNRSAALNRAAELAGDWDVAVCIDADVFLGLQQVEEAIAVALHTGRPGIAYTERIHLTDKGSQLVMDGWKGNWRTKAEFVKRDSCSSANVIRRDLWDAMGGYDELFSGWGWEDVAFKHAAETIAHAATFRAVGPIWHLWHPNSAERTNRSPLFHQNAQRGSLYGAALGDEARMRHLLAGGS